MALFYAKWLTGLDKPEAYGGQGGDYYTSLVLAEEMLKEADAFDRIE